MGKGAGFSLFRFGDGRMLEQHKNANGLSRSDGPALVERSADGTIISQEYWEDGVKVDRPSTQHVKASGKADNSPT